MSERDGTDNGQYFQDLIDKVREKHRGLKNVRFLGTPVDRRPFLDRLIERTLELQEEKRQKARQSTERK